MACPKRNKHHWQYWVLLNDKSNVTEWAIWEHNIGSPPMIARHNDALVFCLAQHDDAIHSKANAALNVIVEHLNKPKALPMPERYICEMVADWRGAGRAYGDPIPKVGILKTGIVRLCTQKRAGG